MLAEFLGKVKRFNINLVEGLPASKTNIVPPATPPTPSTPLPPAVAVVVKSEDDADRIGHAATQEEEDDAAMGVLRWDLEVERRICLDLNLFICLACAGSKYSSREKLNLIRHIRLKHLPDFQGFVCELCPRILNTRRGFEAHMSVLHNILTVHHEKQQGGPLVKAEEEESIVDDGHD
jgi:hypothetical protein